MDSDEKIKDDPGMTLRDYFAAKAMVGMVGDYTAGDPDLAEAAYSVADTMIAEREKKSRENQTETLA